MRARRSLPLQVLQRSHAHACGGQAGKGAFLHSECGKAAFLHSEWREAAFTRVGQSFVVCVRLVVIGVSSRRGWVICCDTGSSSASLGR